MRRLADFSNAQQLIVPLLLAGVYEAWRFGTGRITWSSIKRNPLDEIFPAIATAGLIVIYQIMMSAKELNTQLISEAEKNRPTIIHPENVFRRPSKAPIVVIALILSGVVVLAESFVLEHAYPQDAMVIKPTFPPVRPAEHTSVPTSATVNPPSGFIQFDRTELVDNPSTIEQGSRLAFNVYITNAGTAPVRNARRLVGFEYGGNTKAEENRVEKNFDRDVQAKRKEYRRGMRIDDIGSGHGAWATVGEQSMSETNAMGVLDGSIRIYIFWWAEWDDLSSKQPYARGCQWLQKPPTKVLTPANLIWHFCD
jgi:hypothetical protein